jgi:putative flavoprotein involved in K+ transport
MQLERMSSDARLQRRAKLSTLHPRRPTAPRAGNQQETPMTSSTPTAVVQQWLNDLGAALGRGDAAAAAALFNEESYWRDMVSFTWNITTAEGRDKVREMIERAVIPARPGAWALDEDASEAGGVTEAWITFETAVARGYGHLRLQNGKCWTLLTTMTELKGFEEHRGPTRDRGVMHGVDPNRQTWLERRAQEQAELGTKTQPYCLIIGGGQGGIGLGARMRRLGVPTIIVEKNPKPGDSWRRRYKSLCLHDPVWYDHLPYLPFPDDWPVFAPKDKIGDWLEMYTKVMELNYWASTECEKAAWDEAAQEWVVRLVREGKPVTLRPKHLVLATGMSAVPNMPKVAGMEDFKGTIQHSSQHPGAEGWRGKKCVVIGSNNSSHDICAALWEGGADVTMVQRSSTHIARSDSLMDLALGGLYSEAAVKNGITTNKADMIFASLPYKILHTLQIPVYAEMAKRDADFYAKLEKAGFMLDFGEDGSGLFMKYLRRGSGYYIDVGASELVAEGKIKLKSRAAIERIEAHSIRFSDGSELPADLIVFATGYSSMNGWAAKLIGQDVADRVGKCWGLGSNTNKDPGPWEGELRNMWKPTHQKALWFHGGNLHQSRHYSQFLSLQLKARMESIPTPVYGMGPVHHLS